MLIPVLGAVVPAAPDTVTPHDGPLPLSGEPLAGARAVVLEIAVVEFPFIVYGTADGRLVVSLRRVLQFRFPILGLGPEHGQRVEPPAMVRPGPPADDRSTAYPLDLVGAQMKTEVTAKFHTAPTAAPSRPASHHGTARSKRKSARTTLTKAPAPQIR